MSRNGKVCFVKSFGDKDTVDPKVEMGQNNIFQIASMTKIVTSVAALMLIQEGKKDRILCKYPSTRVINQSSNHLKLPSPFCSHYHQTLHFFEQSPAGKISLDDKISDFFPTSEVINSTGDEPTPCNEAITVRHVMTHTAGFSYMFNRPVLSIH